MTNNKNNYASELNDPQGIDRSLLEYLKPKSEDRYSKLEVYCDLLTRATSGTYSTSVVVGNLKILPGQFVATISELARKWQWQRATVRQFLTGLVNLGHLNMEQYSKSYVFSVSQKQRLSLFVETPSDILDFNALQFVRFLKGRNTSSQVAQSYNCYFNKVMELAVTENDGGRPDCHVLKQQSLVFDSLVKSIFQILKMEKEMPEEMTDSTGLLFGKDHVWDWQKVIDILGILVVAIRENRKPSYMVETVSCYTKAEIILLDSIFEYYVSDQGSFYYDDPPRPDLSPVGNKTDYKPGGTSSVENGTD